MVEEHEARVAAIDLRRSEAQQLDVERRLKMTGPGGTSGGVTEDWKDSVNGQLTQLHDDVRRLTGWIIAGAVAPFVAIIGLYAFTSLKSDNVSNRIVAVESRMTALQVEQAKQGGKLDLLLERKAARPNQ